MANLVVVLASLSANEQAPQQRIKHVVVLYQENRAVDHLLGWDKRLGIDGLTGKETNPIDPADPSKGSVKVYDGAPYVDDTLKESLELELNRLDFIHILFYLNISLHILIRMFHYRLHYPISFCLFCDIV